MDWTTIVIVALVVVGVNVSIWKICNSVSKVRSNGQTDERICNLEKRVKTLENTKKRK